MQTSPEGTIRTEQLWKRFRADRRSRYLQDEIGRFAERLTGRHESTRWRWALRGIDFAVEPGSSVGLVGVNGSGKTTLLKIINQVMYPTVGRVQTNGRIGALVAISAGIHPNLTGRENVMLTASFMGLTRKQAAARFDEIVSFAELEDAIDRQAKYYSMGMQARLGFGVAAFLEPTTIYSWTKYSPSAMPPFSSAVSTGCGMSSRREQRWSSSHMTLPLSRPRVPAASGSPMAGSSPTARPERCSAPTAARRKPEG